MVQAVAEGHTTPFDVVLTEFFIDATSSVVDTIEGIHAAIAKPGGLWINIGPLQYHSDPYGAAAATAPDGAHHGTTVHHLSVDQIVAVVEAHNMTLLDPPCASELQQLGPAARGMRVTGCTYTPQPPGGTLFDPGAYNCLFFAAQAGAGSSQTRN